MPGVAAVILLSAAAFLRFLQKRKIISKRGLTYHSLYAKLAKLPKTAGVL